MGYLSNITSSNGDMITSAKINATLPELTNSSGSISGHLNYAHIRTRVAGSGDIRL